MRRLLVTGLACAGVAACGGGSMTAPPATPPAATPVNFTAFTLGVLRTQSDTAQPAPVDPAQLVFTDDDNPQAFAAVLPTT